MIGFVLLVVAVGCRAMPKSLQKDTCIEGLPYMSVGVRVSNTITDGLLISTHEGCSSCCHHEGLFKQIASSIPVYRMEMRDNVAYMEKHGINRFPFVQLWRGGEVSAYNDVLDYERLSAFVQRQGYLDVCSTLEELESKQHDVIIIGVFYGSRDWKEEIVRFEKVAKTVVSRNYRVHFYLLTNKKQVKLAKQKYGALWFDDWSLSSILVQRHTNPHIITIDENMESEIQKRALPLVDELLRVTYPFYMSRPTLIVVVDSIVATTQSVAYLHLLESVAQEFEDSIYVAWIEGALNVERVRLLGLSKESTPALAFLRLDSEVKAVYTGDVYDMGRVREYVREYIGRDKQTLNIETQKVNISQTLNFTSNHRIKLEFRVHSIPNTQELVQHVHHMKDLIREFNQHTRIGVVVTVDQAFVYGPTHIDVVLINGSESHYYDGEWNDCDGLLLLASSTGQVAFPLQHSYSFYFNQFTQQLLTQQI